MLYNVPASGPQGILPGANGGTMNRQDAVEQYNQALKMGKKYYNSCVAQGVSPYPLVLDQILSGVSTAGTADLGVIEIPSERIVGTYSEGRKAAFAGNFMPLLESNTEFGGKWIDLCYSHLAENGIRDPVKAYEYLGKFYIQEGNKRVSVLRSFDAPSVPGQVTRIIPVLTDDPEIQRYYEFLRFYKATRLYSVFFTQAGGYVKLQAALGMEPDQVWTEEDRRSFGSAFRRFTDAFTQLGGDKLSVTPADALLTFLQVHPYADWKDQMSDGIRASLQALWPDVQLLAKGEPISVSTEPETADKRPLITRIFGTPKLHAAFIYDFDPRFSAWASAHEQGQKDLQEALGDEIKISQYMCEPSADAAMEQAVQAGANVLFATSPTLIDACRRLAAQHKNIAVFNCSLSMPYAGVRSYYCRIYEGKYITGAIAGAMADGNRIGYVANYPIMGVAAGINAFALGAKLTNPRARISLKWTCLPGDPIREFREEGISVVSNRDADGARPYLAWALGTYQMNPDGSARPLASPRWNWGKFYEQAIRGIMQNGIESARSNKAVNNWWGISTGVVDVDIDETLPNGVTQLANFLKQGIKNEEIDPFLRPIKDQSGAQISDGTRRFTPEELMGMDWLCDNVDGVIPGFDDLLPQSQGLVRLLGVHREQIPPVTEEKAL